MSSQRYFESVFEVLEAVRSEEGETLHQAALMMAEAVKGDCGIYTFGTGHSSLLASEGLFRAGGLACVSAILEPTTTFEVGALASSLFERLQDYAGLLLDRYELGTGDVLVVFSNSGANALPVEVAIEAARRGAKTIAVTSRAYAAQAPRTATSGESLANVAHLVLDNHVPPGDAVVPFYDDRLRAASVSTVAGAFIWNALVAETITVLEGEGFPAPVYISSNMPGADEHNSALISRYRAKVRHL
jgi:uncharacterized phosphosugar-binding protein